MQSVKAASTLLELLPSQLCEGVSIVDGENECLRVDWLNAGGRDLLNSLHAFHRSVGHNSHSITTMY
jgi:hypothetical protein